MQQHRDGTATPVTKGRDPKLVYFEHLDSRALTVQM